MALVLLGTERAGGSPAGLTIPEGTVAIVLAPRPGQVYDSDAFGAASIGGVSFTLHEGNVFALCADISARTNDTLTYSGVPVAFVWYIGGNAPAYWESAAGLETTCEAPTNGGNVVGFWYTNGYAGDPSPYYDTVVYSEAVSAGWEVAGTAGPGDDDTAVRCGSSNSWSLFQSAANLFIYESSPAAVIEPGALGMEWGVVDPGPTLVVSEDVVNYAPALGMEWGVVLPGPRVAPAGPRHFMLTGESIRTPEMTEALRGDGSPAEDGDVPTWHTDRKPTLEAPSAGALALDDLTDVDAAAPDDGDTLAWDDYAGAWVPVAAGTPNLSAAALDDIGDVNAPAPADGDTLAWDDSAGEWVAAAPSAPGGDVPGALKVYLYNTFK